MIAQERRRLLVKLASFEVNSLVTAAVPLLTAPVAFGVAGGGAWQSIALGQAIGMVGTVFISFGWNSFGPVLAAQSDNASRLYAVSLMGRFLLLVLVAPFAFIASALLAPNLFLGLVACLSTLTVGLRSGWMFIGTGRPNGLLAHDTIPKVAFGMVGLLLAVVFQSVVVFVALDVLGGVWAIVATTRVFTRASDFKDLSFPEIWQSFGRLRSAFGVGLATSIYGVAMVPLIGMFSPSLAGMFALLSRVQQLFLSLLGPVINVLQSWVPTGKGSDFRSRSRRGGAWVVCGAFLTAICAFAVVPHAVEMLSGDTVTISMGVAALSALLISVIFASQYSGLVVLVGAGLGSTVFRSTVVGSVVCLIGVPIAAGSGSLAGVVGVVCAGEAVVLAWQCAAIIRLFTR